MPVFRFGDFELDTQCFELRRGASVVRLQRRAFDVLAYVVARRERVVGKDELAAEVWRGAHVGDAAISVAVSSVRRALCDDPREPIWLATVYGRGYQFVGEASDVSQPESPRHSARAQASRRCETLATPPHCDVARWCVVLGDLAARRASHEVAAIHYRRALELIGVTSSGEKAVRRHDEPSSRSSPLPASRCL